VFILNSILICYENLRSRSMLVSGMSIVKSFLTIFLMSPTNFELLFADLHGILAGLFYVFFDDRW
jgi:hypothetical protein